MSTEETPVGLKSFDLRLEERNGFDGQLAVGAAEFNRKTHRTGAGKPSSGELLPEYLTVIDDTGIERYQRKENLWEAVDQCPVCGSTDRTFFLRRFAIDIYRCASCHHGYMNPRIKYDVLSGMYAGDKTAEKIYTSPLQVEVDHKKYAYGVETIDAFAPPSRERIMDIGCGPGVFLEVAHASGWKRCVGVDINALYKPRYEDIDGVQFVTSPFEELTADIVGDGYQCISMWSFLEHLYDLKGALAKVHSLLCDGGVFFVLVPNVNSLATRLMRERSPCFNWQHVSHFTPDSLKRVMSDNGFKLEHMESAITEIGNVKSYMSGEHPYNGYGDPDGLFDFITPEYIHKNMLGSRLIGVFRKA